MSNFPKAHGLKLTKNSYIENFAVDKLDVDPSDITTAGHAWFNNNEKKFKCTSLDTDGVTIVIKAFATIDELNSAISGSSISVYDEGTQISSAVTKFNFIGANVQAMSDDGKEVNVYLPPPTFTSHWNTNDGTVTNNTIPDVSVTSRNIASPTSEGTPYKIGDWVGGSAHSVIGSGTLTYTSPGKVCFDNSTSTFTASVLDADGTTVLASCQHTAISGDVTKTNQNITVTISSWESQFNKFKANISVSFNIASILPSGGRFSILITHQSTNTYTKSQNNLFYDNSILIPTLTGIDIALNTLNSTKYISGVRYFDKTDSFNISISDIDNVNSYTYPTNVIQVEANNYYGIPDFSIATNELTNWTNIHNNTNSSYAGVKTITRSNFRRNVATSIDAYPTDNSGTKIYSTAASILVDTYTASSTDINEDFVDESKRLTGTWTSWVSTQALAAQDLMVGGGVLRRQYGNWTLFQPTNTSNYEPANTQVQYYYRGFKHSGTAHSNGIFNITGCTQADLNSNNVKIWISLNGTTWFLCNALYAGGILTSGAGCRINTDTRPLPQLEFTLGTGGSTAVGTGPSGWGIYVKVEMPNGSTVQLTNLDITNWV